MKQRIPTLNDFINESVDHLNTIHAEFGGTTDNSKPSIFQYTIYRLPTNDEIVEFKQYPDLSPNDIVNGLYYTMVGRGILSERIKGNIIKAIEMLIEKYPEDIKYSDALTIVNNLKPKFTR